jgi:hypothetical protein
MNFQNPTQLRIGMHGDFAGKDFRLIGRSVLGVDISGETYYWNEFNLEAKGGETATLVFEETDTGGDWRLFTQFEPDYPLTAADAATKQVGDSLNLTGTDVRVTLVQRSRVYYIEAEAPEGENVDSIANFFNAEAGDVMQVVSWTGDEVEYYNGILLSPRAVQQAFNLQQVPQATGLNRFARLDGGDDSENYLGTGKFILWVLAIGLIFLVLFGRNFSCSSGHESAAVKRNYATAKPPLMVGATGKFDGTNLRVTAPAIVEMAEVSAIFERHEYELTDDNGRVSLLVCGEKPGATDWTLYTPLTPLVSPTPQECAAKKCGDWVTIADVTATVRELFQSTVRNMDNVAATSWHQGDVNFGYFARGQNDLLFARWDNTDSKFYRGEKVLAASVTAAFTSEK